MTADDKSDSMLALISIKKKEIKHQHQHKFQYKHSNTDDFIIKYTQAWKII